MLNGKIGGVEIPIEKLVKRFIERVVSKDIDNGFIKKITNNDNLLEKFKENRTQFIQYIEERKSRIRTPQDLGKLIKEAYHEVGREFMDTLLKDNQESKKEQTPK